LVVVDICLIVAHIAIPFHYIFDFKNFAAESVDFLKSKERKSYDSDGDPRILKSSITNVSTHPSGLRGKLWAFFEGCDDDAEKAPSPLAHICSILLLSPLR
jgi:hypothetical protein